MRGKPEAFPTEEIKDKIDGIGRMDTLKELLSHAGSPIPDLGKTKGRIRKLRSPMYGLRNGRRRHQEILSLLGALDYNGGAFGLIYLASIGNNNKGFERINQMQLAYIPASISLEDWREVFSITAYHPNVSEYVYDEETGLVVSRIKSKAITPEYPQRRPDNTTRWEKYDLTTSSGESLTVYDVWEADYDPASGEINIAQKIKWEDILNTANLDSAEAAGVNLRVNKLEENKDQLISERIVTYPHLPGQEIVALVAFVKNENGSWVVQSSSVVVRPREDKKS